MDLTAETTLALTEAMTINSGSLSFVSGSHTVTLSCVCGYGYYFGYTSTETGFTERANQISVLVPQSPSLNALKPNLNVSLVGQKISGSFRIVQMNNWNQQYVWLTLANRSDVKVVNNR